jgi:acyl-CoA synthetase (AMP-forming)/AMP-acid ligase II
MAMGLHDFTFYDLINRNAVCLGDKTAWLEADDGRLMTYAEIRDRVDRLAWGLKRIGVVKGDRIAVLAKNSLEYFLLLGAAGTLGAVMLPVNWRLSVDEIVFILKDGRPRVLFTDDESKELIRGVEDQLPSVEKYLSLGAGRPDFMGLLESEGDRRHGTEVASDDGFVIIYTAAVAGRPRGALLSHGNVLCADMHFDYLMNITSRDVHLCFLPLFHVGGLFMTTAGFHAGALNINMSRFDVVKAVDLIGERGVTFMMVFSPTLASILEEHEKTGKPVASLRAVTGIDTKETIEKYQKTTGGSFWCLYGQTETSCLATFGAYNDRPGSAGKALPLTEVRLVDDYDRPVPAGQVGEITVRGPMVFKGYWNLPEDTAYTFREGRHHTGDLGRFDEEGFLWYAGRKAEKELIKPGGENVYPAEVEKVILQHPAVEKTVVFGVPDPKWKEGIKAVCTLKEGQTLTAKALIDFVGERIARYKKPQYVDFATELPLMADGSVDRAKAKALYGGQ